MACVCFVSPIHLKGRLFASEVPSAPEIGGLPQNGTLREGQSVALVCSCGDGSPPPTLQWYLGPGHQHPLHSNATSRSQRHVSATLHLTVAREDNDREYR
jgi:hypothetical protein